MKKILALTGSVLLIVGCFLPVVFSAQNKTMNFFDKDINIPMQNIPDHAMLYAGILLIGAASIAAILAMMNKTKFIWLLGIISTGVLAGVYFGFHATLNEMKEQTNKQFDSLLGGMFKDVTDSLFQSVQLGGAGWYVIGSGALLLIISSFVKDYNPSSFTK